LNPPKEASALSCHAKLAPTYDAFCFETRFNWLRVFDSTSRMLPNKDGDGFPVESGSDDTKD
jgi:hypothetical protein